MKNILLALILSLSCLTASALAPPSPRAVVIQGNLVNGRLDIQGRQLALNLAAQHFAQDRLIAVVQRAEFQFPDRNYLCVEYKSTDDFIAATEEFKYLLSKNPSLDVVANTSCQ